MEVVKLWKGCDGLDDLWNGEGEVKDHSGKGDLNMHLDRDAGCLDHSTPRSTQLHASTPIKTQHCNATVVVHHAPSPTKGDDFVRSQRIQV